MRGRLAIAAQAGALLLVVLGLLSVLSAWRASGVAGERVQTTIGQLADLERIRAVTQHEDAALAAMEARATATVRPDALRGLARIHLPGAILALQERKPNAVSERLAVVGVDVDVHDVSVEQVVAWVEAAEAATPAWRLVRLEVDASRVAPGRGDARVTFEAMVHPAD